MLPERATYCRSNMLPVLWCKCGFRRQLFRNQKSQETPVTPYWNYTFPRQLQWLLQNACRAIMTCQSHVSITQPNGSTTDHVKSCSYLNRLSAINCCSFQFPLLCTVTLSSEILARPATLYASLPVVQRRFNFGE